MGREASRVSLRGLDRDGHVRKAPRDDEEPLEQAPHLPTHQHVLVEALRLDGAHRMRVRGQRGHHATTLSTARVFPDPSPYCKCLEPLHHAQVQMAVAKKAALLLQYRDLTHRVDLHYREKAEQPDRLPSRSRAEQEAFFKRLEERGYGEHVTTTLPEGIYLLPIAQPRGPPGQLPPFSPSTPVLGPLLAKYTFDSSFFPKSSCGDLGSFLSEMVSTSLHLARETKVWEENLLAALSSLPRCLEAAAAEEEAAEQPEDMAGLNGASTPPLSSSSPSSSSHACSTQASSPPISPVDQSSANPCPRKEFGGEAGTEHLPSPPSTSNWSAASTPAADHLPYSPFSSASSSDDDIPYSSASSFRASSSTSTLSTLPSALTAPANTFRTMSPVPVIDDLVIIHDECPPRRRSSSWRPTLRRLNPTNANTGRWMPLRRHRHLPDDLVIVRNKDGRLTWPSLLRLMGVKARSGGSALGAALREKLSRIQPDVL